MREHCDDKDKYFLVDRIPETPVELGFEPDSPTPRLMGIVPGCRGGGARIGGTRRRGVLARGRKFF